MKPGNKQQQPGGINKRLALFLAGVFCFSGLFIACVDDTPRVTVGREFPIERVVALKRHVSSKKDVLELMGEPYKKTTKSGRLKEWRYFFRKETKEAVFFFFEGETQVKEGELIIVFDGPLVESLTKNMDTYTN
jgi:outer membrane protein assembly factor BamE (lipoprotein component of BamABCDE complex)